MSKVEIPAGALDCVSPQADPSDPFGAPYDQSTGEAWTTVEELAEHRLGKYDWMGNSAYVAAPPGAHKLGFQQEYPIGFYTDQGGTPLLTNLVLKGVFRRTGGRPLWMCVHTAIIGRSGKQGHIAFFEPLSLVQHSTDRLINDEVFTLNGNFASDLRKQRTIRALRQAKHYLYLPESVIFGREQEES